MQAVAEATFVGQSGRADASGHPTPMVVQHDSVILLTDGQQCLVSAADRVDCVANPLCLHPGITLPIYWHIRVGLHQHQDCVLGHCEWPAPAAQDLAADLLAS